eukprot:1185405-Prorocentrum_minimum.AAC.2
MHESTISSRAASFATSCHPSAFAVPTTPDALLPPIARNEARILLVGTLLTIFTWNRHAVEARGLTTTEFITFAVNDIAIVTTDDYR